MADYSLGLISDTHGALHPDVFRLFDGVDLIVHAGDVVGEEVLTELEAVAPVCAVAGNCDFPSAALPLVREVETPFGLLVVTHSHAIGTGSPSPHDLVFHFRDLNPRLIVFGHTHQAYNRVIDEVRVVNPGPAGRPRLRDRPQVVRLDWDAATGSLSFETTPLDWSRARHLSENPGRR